MKQPIVILHGWGCTGKKYEAIQKLFEKEGYSVYSPDFPGFGEEKLIKPAMNLDDYVAFLYEYLQKNQLKKVYVVAHSFGGRVVSKFIAKHPGIVEKLVITGSPLIKKDLPFHKRAIQKVVSSGKKLTRRMPSPIFERSRWLLYRLLGEYDYYRSQNLRDTFVQIVTEDVSPNLPFITIPTLIIWGEEDTMVPVSLAKEIQAKIQDSRLVVMKHVGHKAPYAAPDIFAKYVLRFFA